MSASALARYVGIALGLEMAALALGALFRTIAARPWSAVDWSAIVSTGVGATVGLTVTLIPAKHWKRNRSGIAQLLRNIVLSIFLVLGMLSVLTTYRLLAMPSAHLDYGTKSLMILAGGVVLGIGMTMMERDKKGG